MLTVVVEVELGWGSGPEETSHPTLLLEGPGNLHLLQSGTLETQEQCLTFDRVLGPNAAQEAEQELLARVRGALGSVCHGYSVALLLQGWETKAPRLVPQLLHVLFEKALPLRDSNQVLSTLCLVQLSSSGRARDLLSPGAENLSVLEVPPLGLIVEDASEVEVSDPRAASELYLQVAESEGRACCLLTLTMSCSGLDPSGGPETQSVLRGSLRILQLPGARDCPLLQVLAGVAVDEDIEGSLPWIVSRLLEGNNYCGLLLRLDPQGISPSLLQAALLGASRRRMEVKEVRPTLWDAVEEARTRRASLKTLRSVLLGDTLTDDGVSQLGRALRELQVVKAWSQHPGSQMFKEAKVEAVGLPESQVMDPAASHSPDLQREPQGRTAALGPGCHQKHLLRDTEEQAPDVALQFFLAHARRQKLREQHQTRIREELKHLKQEEEDVAGDQVKALVARKFSEERWRQEQTVLRLQLEGLQAERDAAEQDLATLYELHVQAARARTRHVLQVFQTWRRLWEEAAMTAEHHHRSLLASVLQDSISLATQNQELQVQNQQLHQGAEDKATEAQKVNAQEQLRKW